MQFQFDSLHKKTHKILKRQTAKSVMAIKKAKTMVIICEISNGIKYPYIEIVAIIIICCNFWFLWTALSLITVPVMIFLPRF